MQIESSEVFLKNGIRAALRFAAPSDAQNVLEHLRTSGQESYRNLNLPASHWNSMTVSDEETTLRDFESASHKFLLIAEIEGKVVGGLGLVGTLGEFLKHNATLGMAIQNQFSQIGLGSALVRRALQQATLVGFRRITLTVRTYNDPAIRLYEKFGFRRVGTLTEAAFIDGGYVDEFFYELILDGLGFVDEP